MSVDRNYCWKYRISSSHHVGLQKTNHTTHIHHSSDDIGEDSIFECPLNTRIPTNNNCLVWYLVVVPPDFYSSINELENEGNNRATTIRPLSLDVSLAAISNSQNRFFRIFPTLFDTADIEFVFLGRFYVRLNHTLSLNHSLNLTGTFIPIIRTYISILLVYFLFYVYGCRISSKLFKYKEFQILNHLD